MRTGDQVRVYPHGKPELAATGRVTLVSDNQLSIAVAFTDKPPFAIIATLGVWQKDEWLRLIVLVRGQVSIAGPGYCFTEIVSGDGFEVEEL